MNAQSFSEDDKAALVEEANLVFRYNIAIFEELEGVCVFVCVCVCVCMF